MSQSYLLHPTVVAVEIGAIHEIQYRELSRPNQCEYVAYRLCAQPGSFITVEDYRYDIVEQMKLILAEFERMTTKDRDFEELEDFFCLGAHPMALFQMFAQMELKKAINRVPALAQIKVMTTGTTNRPIVRFDDVEDDIKPDAVFFFSPLPRTRASSKGIGVFSWQFNGTLIVTNGQKRAVVCTLNKKDRQLEVVFLSDRVYETTTGGSFSSLQLDTFLKTGQVPIPMNFGIDDVKPFPNEEEIEKITT